MAFAFVQAKGTLPVLEVRVGASVLSIAVLWGWERAGAIAKARRGRMYVGFIFKLMVCRAVS